MKFTRRNHYNPCFWTALWNPDFYSAVIDGRGSAGDPRKQPVYALNVKTGQIRKSAVNDVHYDKGMGVAEISRKAAEDFAKRYHPEEYEQFLVDNVDAPYPVYIDFEEFFTGTERMRPYEMLMQVAQSATVNTLWNKTELAVFVLLQQLRSHSILNATIEWGEELGRHKFEAFITLKWLLQDPEELARLTLPLIKGRWTLFSTARDTFPLCDSPVLAQPRGVMVALSPRLLLEIQKPIHDHIDRMPRVRRRAKKSKVEEFRRRTIGNTFREIIFGNRETLEAWQESIEFEERVVLMKDTKKYNRLVVAEDNRELWHINAFGNME